MERYKFTFADGSSTEELFDSDNEAIVAATAANGGSSGGCTSSATTIAGRCCPRNFLPVGTAEHGARRSPPRVQ
ncbi:hypothetical protein [Rhodococcus sp. OAS809]|uniref:hypothetical protein n=1 Tax=Rhodococcus sp. OAS809 TaxID=2663874 RepID=UPI001A0AD207